MRIQSNQKYLLAAIALLFSFGVLAQSTYTWTDEKGRKVYGDKPPQNVNAKELTNSLPKIPTQTQAAKKPVQVSIITTPEGCPLCESGKELLKDRSVPYSDQVAQTAQDKEKVKLDLGGKAAIYPILIIGDNKYPGYNETEWNNYLDEAGFPRGKGKKTTAEGTKETKDLKDPKGGGDAAAKRPRPVMAVEALDFPPPLRK
jgi:hypothetical protein